MSFASSEFLVFFPAFLGLYYLLPPSRRWLLILAASVLFYGWFRIDYLALLAVAMVVGYSGGVVLHGCAPERRKVLLWTFISALLAPLMLFKYLDFMVQSAVDLAALLGMEYAVGLFAIILPIGISFYTFQIIGYLVDVSRGEVEPERNILRFALFVSFFPQLVSGPIERAKSLLPQLRLEHRFEYQRVTDGLKLMAWGLIKKVVIADNLAVVVDTVYAAPAEHGGFHLATATFFFVFQVYCDFSGYSDIAIGAALVLGIRLMTNFERPYFATSISDLWRRWHISLTTWFYDYIYHPVAFHYRSRGINAIVIAIMVTFALSGLWHGAQWTFVLFGVFHGVGLCIEALTRKQRKRLAKRAPKRLYHACSIAFVFCFVFVADVMFRASSIGEAWMILASLPGGLWSDAHTVLTSSDPVSSLKVLLDGLGTTKARVLLGFGLIFGLIAAEAFQARVEPLEWLRQRPTWVRWAIYYAALLFFLLTGAFNASSQFIYFQF